MLKLAIFAVVGLVFYCALFCAIYLAGIVLWVIPFDLAEWVYGKFTGHGFYDRP